MRSNVYLFPESSLAFKSKIGGCSDTLRGRQSGLINREEFKIGYLLNNYHKSN